MIQFSEKEQELMQRAADGLVKRRFAVPAIMFLETVSPMNMVGSSMLRVLSPMWRAVLPASQIDELATLLERRESVPYFISLIDKADEDRRRKEIADKQLAADSSDN
ncbi:MAG: hypothetical protein ACI9EF_003388 [Pseudohongiellaceae bacterium]|jgi:hypothetical protein